MEYFRAQDTYLVRLDPEEEILTQLHALAEKERIQLAEVSGLGALKEFEICVYNVAEKAFYHNAYTEALELVSLSGTITQLDGNPYLHIHAAAGDSTGRVVGGHLKKAVVSATAEITVHVLEGRFGRKWNEEIGLNLLAFN